MGAYTKNVQTVSGGAYTKVVQGVTLGTGGTIDHGDVNPPFGTNTGDLFFNTADDKLYVWNGTAWVDVT